jgi:hypothetical protein
VAVAFALASLTAAPAAAAHGPGGGCKAVTKHCRADDQCCPGLVCGEEQSCRPGCRIDGVLYDAGERNPANACEACLPVRSTVQWLSAPNGTACDDGDACTTSDACLAGSCAGGPPRDCDDRDICTEDSCEPAAGCVNARVADGEICDTWVTDLGVATSSLQGDTLYIGGPFHWVSPLAPGGFVSLDGQTARPPAEFPKIVGIVSVAAPDGTGGWFVAGGFQSIGGLPRNGLAHILADGAVADWSPSAKLPGGARGLVRTMLVRNNLVYVGGDYIEIGGQPRHSLAALDAATGIATDWNPDASLPDPGNPGQTLAGGVHALALGGSTLYVGGYFTSIGGQPRTSLAALDLTTGLVTGWSPDVSQADPDDPGHVLLGGVELLSVSGQRVYVGGNFSFIGGLPRTNLASFDTTSGLATEWNPSFTWTDPSSGLVDAGQFSALTAGGGLVYVGGFFNTVEGQPRSYLAAVDAVSGGVTDWNPDPNLSSYYVSVNSLMVTGGRVFVAGEFDRIGGQERNAIAEVDATTGLATEWNPELHSGRGFVVASDGARVAVGGDLKVIGGIQRSGLAALDIRTGRPTEWNPPTRVGAGWLVARGDTVYAVAGAATALDAETGQIRWQTDFRGMGGLALVGNTIYTVSPFEVPSYPSGLVSLFAIDTGTGDYVETPIHVGYFDGLGQLFALTADEHAIYLGGQFDEVASQPRNACAALDRATLVPTEWDPGFGDQEVLALASDGDTVYTSGSVVPGTNLAAFDAATADVKWSYPIPRGIRAIALSGNLVYAGGGGSPQQLAALVALDSLTGEPADWHPIAQPSVRSISPGNRVVFTVGSGNLLRDNRLYNGIYAIATDIATAPEGEPAGK